MNDKAPASSLPRSLVAAVPVSVKLAQAIDTTRQLLTALDAELSAINDPVQLARGFVVLRRLKDKIGDLDSAFTALYKSWSEDKFPEALETTGQKFIPLAEGFRVGVSITLRASIKEGMKDKAYHWLRAHKMGSLISSTVNASTLSKAASEMRDDNRDLPDDLFNVYDQSTTSVTQTDK